MRHSAKDMLTSQDGAAMRYARLQTIIPYARIECGSNKQDHLAPEIEVAEARWSGQALMKKRLSGFAV